MCFGCSELKWHLFSKSTKVVPMADSSQFSPLNTLLDQLGPNSWVSSVFIPAFIASIGKHFFLKYDRIPNQLEISFIIVKTFFLS